MKSNAAFVLVSLTIVGGIGERGQAAPVGDTGYTQYRTTERIPQSNLRQQSTRQQSTLRAAQRFLERTRTRFNLPERFGFVGKWSTEASGQHCLNFVESVDAEEIIGTLVRVCMREDGQTIDEEVSLCRGECTADPTERTIGRNDASGRAEEEMIKVLGNEFGDVVSAEVEPVWSPDAKGTISGSYKVEFVTRRMPRDETTPPEGKFIAYIHGTTGEILGIEDRILFAKGRADVYSRDAETTPMLESVALEGLLAPDRLAHPSWVIKQKDDSTPVASSGGVNREGESLFEFDLSDPRFDEAQLYFAMQWAMSKYESWGYTSFGSIPIYARYGDRYNNAFYDGEKIAIGEGDGSVLRNLARDNTVVTHEYGHAVIDHLAHLMVGGPFGLPIPMGNGGAIHEGYADYFACAAYEKPTLGEWAIPNGSPMRRCDTNLDFSEGSGEVHRAGQVMSGALWELRMTLETRKIGDQLVLGSLTRVVPSGWFGSVKFADMYRAVVAADRALFGGAHESVISAIFQRRGFPK